MNILAIESSSKVLSVAVSSKGKLKSKLQTQEQFKSEQIIGLIKEAIDKAGLALSGLDYIAVGLGPGSFTGLRVGLATAKAISLGLRKKIIGIGSLDIIASQLKDSYDEDICTVLDARRGNLYAAVFKRPKKDGSLLLTKKMGYSLINFKQLLGKLKGKIVFVGDGIPLMETMLRQKKSILPLFASRNFWYPKAGILALMAQELLNKGEVKPKPILPFYLYPKECQVRDEK